MWIGRSSSGASGSAAASDSDPKSGGLFRNSVRSLVLPGTVSLVWIMILSGMVVMLVLHVCAFLPE